MEPIWFRPMERWSQFNKIRDSVRMKGITINRRNRYPEVSFNGKHFISLDNTCIIVTL